VGTLANVPVVFLAGVGFVSNHLSKTIRPWRIVAQELSREKDPRRVFELTRELNEALNEQEFQGRTGPQQTSQMKREHIA
jgi:hypothetical protein